MQGVCACYPDVPPSGASPCNHTAPLHTLHPCMHPFVPLRVPGCRPDVDARRIGCTGVSLGGMHTWLAAAADERIVAAAPMIGVQYFRWVGRGQVALLASSTRLPQQRLHRLCSCRCSSALPWPTLLPACSSSPRSWAVQQRRYQARVDSIPLVFQAAAADMAATAAAQQQGGGAAAGGWPGLTPEVVAAVWDKLLPGAAGASVRTLRATNLALVLDWPVAGGQASKGTDFVVELTSPTAVLPAEYVQGGLLPGHLHRPAGACMPDCLDTLFPPRLILAGMRQHYDAPASLPLLAPRPLLIANGELDPRCPMEVGAAAAAAVACLRSLLLLRFAAAGAGTHHLPRDAAMPPRASASGPCNCRPSLSRAPPAPLLAAPPCLHAPVVLPRRACTWRWRRRARPTRRPAPPTGWSSMWKLAPATSAPTACGGR